MSGTELPTPGFQTFRDPDGAVIMQNGRVLRLLSDRARDLLSSILDREPISLAMQEGHLVNTRFLEDEETMSLIAEAHGTWAAVAEHDRIAFVSYPHEWPAEMLHAAGVTTLDLAERLQKEGLGLKDATPYNIVFRELNRCSSTCSASNDGTRAIRFGWRKVSSNAPSCCPCSAGINSAFRVQRLS